MFFSNTQLVEPQWSCLAYPAKVLWSGEDTTPFRQKRIQGVLWWILIFLLNLQIEHWPPGATSGASSPLPKMIGLMQLWPNSQVNAVGRFLCERITTFHWQHQGHYPTSWPRKLLECWAICWRALAALLVIILEGALWAGNYLNQLEIASWYSTMAIGLLSASMGLISPVVRLNGANPLLNRSDHPIIGVFLKGL